MKKGFTLTELLAVIAIIAILSIAAVSGYSAMTRNSKKKVLEQKIQSIEIAAEKYAKENNVSNSVTISVNKLVVMGYLQPDSSADDGYAVILNPVNNENMICNLISIKIVKEEVITEYNENAKDCTIADKDYLDSNIIITAYNFTNETNRLISYEEDNILKWTKEDVLLLVTTNYDIKNIYSFTYEYGGNTIEKHTNLKTATNPHGLDDIDKISEYYNELLISDVGSLFNRDVTVILNMKDGTTNAKRVIVRIDKEPPTGYIVESSDISTNENSERKINLFMDDSNGSGVKGFYANNLKEIDETKFIPKEDSLVNGSYVAGSNKGYFYGKRGTYYIYFKDNVGNISPEPIEVPVYNFDPKELICHVTIKDSSGNTLTKYKEGWFNKTIVLNYKSSDKAGDSSFRWDFLKGVQNITEAQLTRVAKVDNYAELSYTQSTNMELTYYGGGLKGMTTKNNTIKRCNEQVGVDLDKPTVTYSYSGNTTPKQYHTINVTIRDALSGFYPDEGQTNKRVIHYSWSTSSTSPSSHWQAATFTLSGKELSGTITSNLDKTNGSKLTGNYYLFIKQIDTKDKAGNTLKTSDLTPGVVFKFDNTPPTCTIRNVVNHSTSGVSISITCTETGSVKSGCSSSNPTGDSGLTSGKSYTLKDIANNTTSCSVGVSSYKEHRRASAKSCYNADGCGTTTTCTGYHAVCEQNCPTSNSSRTCGACSSHSAGGNEFECAECCNKSTSANYCQHKNCGWNDWGDWSSSVSSCSSNTCKSQERTKYYQTSP